MQVPEEISFSKNLKKLRQRDAINQNELASRVQLDRSAIANYERGHRLPSLEVLTEIALSFNVSLDYLIFGKMGKQKAGNSLLNKELMAENVSLMQENMDLAKNIDKLMGEIGILKTYIEAQKNYLKLIDSKNGSK
jgi:transcriptional regulator with XRE-family HTH domain